jgi:protein-tyrosine phosphatase
MASEARQEPVRVLFVCLGNICRSPTAEGVMRALVAEAGREGEIVIDSAGTGSWHVGSPPDSRASAAAQGRGIALSGSARQVVIDDFFDFDVLLAMDQANRDDLERIAPGGSERAKIRLLREFDPGSVRGDLDVPDPYYGAGDGFGEVLDLVQAACAGLLVEIEAGRVP